MVNILIRFLVIYFLTVVSLRAMGKRQIGEMQMSELVTALFLSELATFCVTDYSVPLIYGILPVLCLISMEVIISFIAVKSKTFKKLFYSYPSILIDNGKVLEKELIKNRVTVEELFSAMRLKDYPDITKIKYAILEANGQISVVPFDKNTSVSKEDMHVEPNESGFSRVIVDNGKVNEMALFEMGKDEKWLQKKLSDNNIRSVCDVFIMTVDESENMTVTYKDK